MTIYVALINIRQWDCMICLKITFKVTFHQLYGEDVHLFHSLLQLVLGRRSHGINIFIPPVVIIGGVCGIDLFEFHTKKHSSMCQNVLFHRPLSILLLDIAELQALSIRHKINANKKVAMPVKDFAIL